MVARYLNSIEVLPHGRLTLLLAINNKVHWLFYL